MSKLPINLHDLLRQRTVEGERIEYKAGWNPDPIIRTVCAFANDFENLGGGYVVIGQDCDANGQPVFPPVGLADNQLDKIQQELLGRLPVDPAAVLPGIEHRGSRGAQADRAVGTGRAEPALQSAGSHYGEAQGLEVLHPQVQQHGRGQGRNRARLVEPGGQGVIR